MATIIKCGLPMRDQNGGLYLIEDILFSRVMSGDEFDLDDYKEISKFISEKHPTLSMDEKSKIMDELLFKKKE
jgi:hypothetical protein